MPEIIEQTGSSYISNSETGSVLRANQGTWTFASGRSIQAQTVRIYSDNVGTSVESPEFQVGVPQNTVQINQDLGEEPEVIFNFIKEGLNLIQKRKLNKIIKQLSDAADVARQNGQISLEKKFTNNCICYMREAEMHLHGIKFFIEKKDLDDKRNKVRVKGKGKISDTKLSEYTRVIPKKVIKRLEKVKHLFDTFVVLHYFNENQKDVKDMSSEEKARMKDPILFGVIKENDRMYFIADWEDEYCDLTFDELTKVIVRESVFDGSYQPTL